MADYPSTGLESCEYSFTNMLLIDDHQRELLGRWKYNRLADAPISSRWSSSDEREAKAHRLHAYPARFPALVAKSAFAHARTQGIEVKRVADVFCGSGTVAVEAAAEDLDFWGCDINPVATLIARAKTVRLDPDRFAEAARRVGERSPEASETSSLRPSAVERLARWYEPQQFLDLVKLRNSILSQVSNELELLAFDCAFSAILKAASQWRSRSTKPARDGTKRPASVGAAFHAQCASMAAAWAEMPSGSRASVEIVRGCATKAENPGAPIDMIVTSPPYATSYEYADLHQLSALWLEYVDDYRDLRAGFIGTASRRANLAKAMSDLNPIGLQVVFALYNRNRRLAEAMAAYFLDMQRTAQRCHALLRSGGLAVFVIGNTQFDGIRIDNANHLVESLIDAGFENVRVIKRVLSNKPNTPYRLPSGRLSAAPTEMSIYSEEYVLMAQRR
ncbi:MAG TPA: DNA methyltransferase [Allosphingosinicella sp.]|nr:DNA methyltransferase [Allosphingosinicella sp.]